MAVSMNSEVILLGVRKMRALLFGVYTRAPDFWKLSCGQIDEDAHDSRPHANTYHRCIGIPNMYLACVGARMFTHPLAHMFIVHVCACVHSRYIYIYIYIYAAWVMT